MIVVEYRLIVVMMVVETAEAAGAIQESGAEVSALATLRHAAARWAHQGARPRLASGVEGLDELLGGGWPVGMLGEVVGPPCSGRTAVATATVATVTRRGEVAAWIEVGDAFDPGGAARCGVVLQRLLWVRAEGEEQAVRAAEIVLETGGVPVVVVDLAAVGGGGWERRVPARRPGAGGGERRDALALRLGRAGERAGAVVLVLAERPWGKGRRGARVALHRGAVLWGGEGNAPRWLVGLAVRATVERWGGATVAGAVLRFAWERGPLGGAPARGQVPGLSAIPPSPRTQDRRHVGA